MNVSLKILAMVAMPAMVCSVQARVWTNDRGATVRGVLLSVRETEVDLRLPDGRIVALPRSIFSGEDQTYIQNWVQSGGTLVDEDAGSLTPEEQARVTKYMRSMPNWDATWPAKAGLKGLILIKTVQETAEWCVYETDHFVIESAKKLTDEEQQAIAGKFETVLEAMAALPLNLSVARKPSRKYLVRVCFTEEEMAAVHGLRKGHLMFSPTSFTVLLTRDKKGKAKELNLIDPRFAFGHWVMQSLDMSHWVVDAFAAYLEFVPEKEFKLSFIQLPKRLSNLLPRDIRTGKTAIPAFSDVLARKSLHTVEGHGKEDGIKNAAAWGDLLWIVYWLHMEGDGQGMRMRKFMRAWIEDGEQQALKILLDGKTPEQIQQEMAEAWKKHGVKLKFDEPKAAAAEVKG